MAIQYGPPSRNVGTGIRYAPVVGYNPAAYVPGGVNLAIAQATQNQGFGQPSYVAQGAYNPAAYVPGGSSPAVAQAIQNQGFGQRVALPTSGASGQPVRSTQGVSMTAAQVANQRAQAQLAPQIAAQDAFNARQNAAISQFAQALMGKLQPFAGQIGQQYDTAIGQQSAIAGQSAQFLQNANPSADVQALEQSIGAPAAQQAQTTQQLGDTFGGGGAVLNYLGGQVPAQELLTDKTAAVGQATQYPLLAGLQGQQDLSIALGQQTDARNQLLATRPALYQAALQDIRTNQANKAQLAQSQKTLALQQANAKESKREFGITTRTQANQFITSQAAVASRFAKTRSDNQAIATAAAIAKANTNAQANIRAFGTFLTSPGFLKETWTPQSLIAYAKQGFGITLPPNFQVPTATAPVQKPNWQVVTTGKGIVAVNKNDPTQPTVPIGPNVVKPGAPPKPFAAKDGTVWVYDPKTRSITNLYTPAAGQPKVAVGLSRARGQWVDSNGVQIPGSQAWGKPPSLRAPTKPGGLTPGEGESIMGRVQSVIKGSGTPTGGHYYQGTLVPGSQTAPKTYQEVRQQIVSMIPPGRKDLLQRAINQLNSDPNYEPGENSRPYETIQQAVPNIEENVASAIAAGSPASAAYQTAIGTGVYPPKLRKALVYEINRIYTQDYFKKHPHATSLPANVLVTGPGT